MFNWKFKKCGAFKKLKFKREPKPKLYRVIIEDSVYHSYIVEADSIEEALDKGDRGDHKFTVYDNDVGEYGVIEVIETKDYDPEDIYDCIEHDGEIVWKGYS